MPSDNKKVTHAKTNLQLSAFVLVCVTFLLPPSIKGLIKQLKVSHLGGSLLDYSYLLKSFYLINTYFPMNIYFSDHDAVKLR